VIYRRYASLYFIIGIDIDEEINELSLLEFIHNMVETLDKYFENVCELDVSRNAALLFTHALLIPVRGCSLCADNV
jgi:hypothetical protein